MFVFFDLCVRCAELLVMKAELELMKGASEESRLDLDKVRNLLEICSGLENSIYTFTTSRHTMECSEIRLNSLNSIYYIQAVTLVTQYFL